MAIFKNYYHILEVETFADPELVKAAYRKLARQHHPDLNSGKAQAEEKFKEINEAYEILGNPDKRAMHDAALKAMQGLGGGKTGAAKKQQTTANPSSPKQKNNPPPTGEKTANQKNKPDSTPKTPKQEHAGNSPGKSPTSPINELFESFLKKGFSESASSHKTPTDEGVFRPKKENSKTSGSEKSQRGEDVVVKTAISPTEASDGVVKTVNVQHNEICRRCSGTGKVSGTVCSACGGDKIMVRLKKIDVRIPAGVKNGSRVRVAKEGGRGSGGAENGDLFLQIEIGYDASLRIEGLDVHGEVLISVTDAALGSEADVPTLNGAVKMTIPAGTQTGKVFRLKERGVQSGLSKGDHFVTVVVVIPENLSHREKELYQELARLRPDKPIPKKPR